MRWLAYSVIFCNATNWYEYDEKWYVENDFRDEKSTLRTHHLSLIALCFKADILDCWIKDWFDIK